LLIILAIVGWICVPLVGWVNFFLARSDRKKIKAGAMDPAGAGLTNAAYWISLIQLVLNILAICAWGGCMAWAMIAAPSAGEYGSVGSGSSLMAEANRIPLSFALSGIKLSCLGDPSGAGAANYFHDAAFGSLQAQACQVTDDTANAFGDANRSQAQGLSGTADESRATAFGVDASQCTLFTSGAAKIIGCTVNDDFRIVHMENVASVQ
jgi:hypothetical protein